MSAKSPVGQSGYTLLELLLAMGISAMIAALAYAGVAISLNAGARLEQEVQQLQQLQRAFNFLEEDLVQLRNRPRTDAAGVLQPALEGGSFAASLLGFTRGGLANPANLERSELVGVSYQLRDGQLLRELWLVLDPADTSVEPVSTALVDQVKTVQVAFLPSLRPGQPTDMQSLNSSLGGWVDNWNSQLQVAPGLPALPLAVRISIDIADVGVVSRVFQLPQ